MNGTPEQTIEVAPFEVPGVTPEEMEQEITKAAVVAKRHDTTQAVTNLDLLK